MCEILRTFRVLVNLTGSAPQNTDTSNHSVLTTTALQALRRKPPSDTKKIPDRDGLYVHVSPAGTIAFRWDFWLGGRGGRRGTLTLGKFPLMTLAEARDALLAAKKDVAAGTDPCRKKLTLRRSAANSGTFHSWWTS